jgi:hypothetical protein
MRAQLLLLGFAVGGCVSTSGQEWLNSPIEQRTEPANVSRVGAEGVTPAPPRLAHTVTLGESYADGPASHPAVDRGTLPSVQVNVHTAVPVVINNMGAYGYAYDYGARPIATPARTTRSSSPQPGADFPPPPDYGPRPLR